MSIFTGWIPRERMIQEHILELAEIEGTTVDELRARHQENPGHEP
jgi:hypothetical protein